MKKRLAVFLLTCIMLTGCTKVIDTQRESTQNNVPTVKSDVEKDFENLLKIIQKHFIGYNKQLTMDIKKCRGCWH